MEASKFRAAQEPLKERYRTDTKAALLTLKAKGTADDSTVTCKVETGRGLAVAAFIRNAADRASSFVRATCCSKHSSLVQGFR